LLFCILFCTVKFVDVDVCIFVGGHPVQALPIVYAFLAGKIDNK